MGKLAVLAALGGVLLLALGSYALADGGSGNARGALIGYEEVPSVSTAASGSFEAKIVGNSKIEYKLSYKDLEGSVQQAHIHFGQRAVNGGISVFFCSNLPNPPAGTQACPPSPAKSVARLCPPM